MTAVWIVLGLIAAVGLYVMMTYNGLVALRNRIENAWGQMDVQLKRRHDLIPNLVEVVKDYMGYEKETLEAVVEARQKAVSAGSREEQVKQEGMLSQALGKLFALAENYPDLKANTNVNQLMGELSETENMIAGSRQVYNDAVVRMNTKVESFPSNIIANMFSFTRETYFEVPEGEKAPVKVDLR